jgi:hypothetical protein
MEPNRHTVRQTSHESFRRCGRLRPGRVLEREPSVCSRAHCDDCSREGRQRGTATTVTGISARRSSVATGCGGLFQVALGNETIQPVVSWLKCLQAFDIATGSTSYPVTVDASYLECVSGRAQGLVEQCQPNGRPPALPAGAYRAVLYQTGHLVPTPPPLAVQVTHAP